MLQREESEAPSDFQDYTLLALVAVAGFLSDTDLGERHGLVALAQRYNQEVEPLQQASFHAPLRTILVGLSPVLQLRWSLSWIQAADCMLTLCLGFVIEKI